MIMQQPVHEEEDAQGSLCTVNALRSMMKRSFAEETMFLC